MSNVGEADITDLYVELDLEGYFKGEHYYDGLDWNIENPVDHIPNLNMLNESQVTLSIQGIDRLLPPGTHRLQLNYQYSYDNGSTPSETSTDYGWLYFNIVAV